MESAGELETYAFNADISQLMSLIINAFYSNKEIFLRELISNASDAMDKIVYQAQAKPEKMQVNPSLYINVTPDRDAGTVTVEDAGIGMTRDELVNNLGTIAKSGTKAFMEAVSSGVDMSMIGQFGVGFYSAYLVSEKVRVVSKSCDDEQHIWESAAGGTFTVWKDETKEHGELTRGTKIICYLKDDQGEFLESSRLKDLILKHSAFVGFPISCYMETRTEEPAAAEGEEPAVTVTRSWELINKNKPVWLRQPHEVEHEEYADLYKWLASDWEEHLGVKHVAQSGQIDFKALLYCPRTAPKDMFDMGKMSHRFSIRLYVRRVFIKEFNDLIPKWMGFIKGIVDSDDMPLNISREQLQQNAILKHIKTGLQKYIFQLFDELSHDPKRSAAFHEAFSQCLKLGVYEDHANRAQIIPLLRYYSSKSGNDVTSLDEYIGRMKPGQTHILYITGTTRRDAAKSPYIESLKRDGYEIIYMIDPVDEYAVQFMKEYKGNTLMSCMNINTRSLLNAGRTIDDLKAELEPLRKRILAELATATNVRSVTFETDLAAEFVGRIALRDDAAEALQLNVKHGILREMAKRSESEGDLPSLIQLIYECAVVDSTDPGEQRRTSAMELCQGLIQRVSAGELDDCSQDMPDFSAPSLAVDLRSLLGGRSNGAKTEAALLSCGSIVRVVKGDRARRAQITFADEDAGVVDVSYPMPGGGEEEEEGVANRYVHALLPFEKDWPAQAGEAQRFQEGLFKAASAAKEEGNQLFKLKDYDAAAERYTAIISGFSGRPVKPGDAVLVVMGEGVKTCLESAMVHSVDADDECELSSGLTLPRASCLPVFDELLPLQTAAHMNRARCRQCLGLHQGAAQDLTVVLALWGAANKRMLEADVEMKTAETKGMYTAQYLRARSRLARGLVKQASADVRDALARNPPPDTVKQLRQLKVEVQAAQEEHRRVHGPLAKELAKISIMLRGGDQIS